MLPGSALRSARRHVRSEHSHSPSLVIMVQALTLSTGTAVLARRGVKVQARRGKAVVARCGKSRAIRVDRRGQPSFSPRQSPTDFAPDGPLSTFPRFRSTRDRAQQVVKAEKREARKGAAVAAAASAPLLAAVPAHAMDALFTVADLSDGVVDEESALYALVGGSLAICTAVLSLVIGSNLFIKNIVNK